MGQTLKAQEPSMEEILASIRRIIADDESKGGAEPPPRPAAAAPPPASPQLPEQDIDAMLSHIDAPTRKQDPSDEGVADVLELTESMAAHASQPPPVFRTVESQPDVFFSEEAPEPPAAISPRPPAMDTPLMSSSTSQAVDAAFNRLAHTVLSHNARTLEDLVKEMLRPMVKAWLDDNLPGLVERLVRAEIERVSRGR